MKLSHLASAFGATLLLAGLASAKDPPLPARTMPGVLKGEGDSLWLAPYVHATRLTVAGNRITTVRWLSRNGNIRREHTSGNLHPNTGYVSDFAAGRILIMGLSGDWQFTLPNKGGPAGYITATPDGRTFYHQYHPAEGLIAVDIYVGGELKGTVGPFSQYRGSSFQPGADGGLALLTGSKLKKKNAVQLIAARGDGAVTIQIDCDGPVMNPVVAPDGRGVLLQPNGDDRNTFSYYTDKGRISSIKPGFNAGLVTWLPKSATALMSTSIGHDYRFHLIDWPAGMGLWAIDDPCRTRVPGMAPSVAITKDYLLFAGREYLPIAGKDEPIRSIYAVAIKSGKTIARWRPTPLRASTDEPWFFEQDGRLYLMTRRDFSEIHLADIAKKTRGWQ